jgi:protein-tyrosine phosphatase
VRDSGWWWCKDTAAPIVNAPFMPIGDTVSMELTITNRELRLEIAHNVRHLGGYPTSSGRSTSETIIRSASLHRLTDSGMRGLAEAGVTTIIDFRSDVERARDVTPSPEPYGIRHIHAPVFQDDASPVGLEHEFTGFGPVYMRFLEMGRNAYRTLIEVSAESEGRVLFHCAAGKDRTGVAAALLLDLAGVDDETIIADYTLTETLLTPMIDQWMPEMRSRGIDEGRARMLLGAPREAIEAAIVHLRETHGTAEGYARDLGVSETTISALRAKLIA